MAKKEQIISLYRGVWNNKRLGIKVPKYKLADSNGLGGHGYPETNEITGQEPEETLPEFFENLYEKRSRKNNEAQKRYVQRRKDALRIGQELKIDFKEKGQDEEQQEGIELSEILKYVKPARPGVFDEPKDMVTRLIAGRIWADALINPCSPVKTKEDACKEAILLDSLIQIM